MAVGRKVKMNLPRIFERSSTAGFDGETSLMATGTPSRHLAVRPPWSEFLVRRVGLSQRIRRVMADEGVIFPSTRATWSRQAWVASRAETSAWRAWPSVRKW